ncbi:MAG: PBP1A family penicillin-binding protein [Betaproteobacteria bacterium]|nr:PBP1A family penicillin-binding protein [Betaproteobacteria bacterium]MBU6513514.1 PBP1A family penicillin-binding protein [Betaproteobacteria bacterium]MDE1956723.1 PBP1A family penicillin-binding protein [Betaproteobacteria bacterium]MDE2152551.1 PBP1A family penicillin-binding protein [Betaproteobacteria bacterium]
MLLLGLVLLGVAGTLYLGLAVILLWPRLPDLSEVTNYRPDLPLRVYSANGTLIGEFGVQRRAVIDYKQVPLQLKQAVLAAEDARFFEHGAIDFAGVVRAALADFGAGGAVQGASTITMQVARDFYLSPEKTPLRKLVETLLAYKIENSLSKDQILDRYINQVYLGQRAYGFAAAAQVYYGKPLQQLSLAQMAVLAGLPQAPSAYNPQSNLKLAVWRQHYVLGRMLALHDITREQYEQALAAPLEVVSGQGALHYSVDADYAAELVRQIMVARFGEAAYTDGYKVTTTLVDKDQTAANAALRAGLSAYDHRMGWRGPEGRVALPPDGARDAAAKAIKRMHDVGGLAPAVVLQVSPRGIEVLRRDGSVQNLSGAALAFCRPGLEPRAPQAKRIEPGSVLRLLQTPQGPQVSQIPLAQSALVSMQPQTGAVQAWVGGFDFTHDKFDHVNQAYRQPGSSFKPFIYSAAVAEGLAPTTIIDDSPISINPGPNQPLWQPHNYEKESIGPMPAAEALARSDNIAAVRVVLAVGVPYARFHASQFGLPLDQIPPYPTMVLGAGSFTPLQMARAYSVFANGGYLVQPRLIQKIVDAHGAVIYQEPKVSLGDADSPRIISPGNAFLLTRMMQQVIASGTGAAARSLGRSDLAGKTGTTSDFRDAWFDGFDHDRVAVAWVGYNTPRSLGRGQQGASVSLPIWMSYMRVAAAADADQPWAAPPDVVQVPVNPATGFASVGSFAVPNAVQGYFLQQYPPLDPAGGAPAPSSGGFLGGLFGHPAPAPAAPAPAPAPAHPGAAGNAPYVVLPSLGAPKP